MAENHPAGEVTKSFDVRILRQAGPGQPSYWERHRVPYEANMNVISVLQKIAAHPRTADGQDVAPVAWDCNCLEEVCGACTMVINGYVQQACSALVDRLLREHPEGIELRPASTFPVVRDLVVDRGRLFQALRKISAWIAVDGYYDRGEGPPQSQEEAEHLYRLSTCMSCGCCLEACPQYKKVELTRGAEESEEEFARRQAEAYDRVYLGPAAISQAVLFNSHPTGSRMASVRLDALIDEGGIQICGNAQNCVVVCPKHIPLTTSIAHAGRDATAHVVRKWFDQ